MKESIKIFLPSIFNMPPMKYIQEHLLLKVKALTYELHRLENMTKDDPSVASTMLLYVSSLRGSIRMFKDVHQYLEGDNEKVFDLMDITYQDTAAKDSQLVEKYLHTFSNLKDDLRKDDMDFLIMS